MRDTNPLPSGAVSRNKLRASDKTLSIDVPPHSSHTVSNPKVSSGGMAPSSIGLAQPPLATQAPLSDHRESVFSAETDPLLRMVAAQEWRVLELKEELKSEEDKLLKLKAQWANQEARRKRSEVQRLEQLRPLSSPTHKTSDSWRKSQDGSESDATIEPAKPRRTKFEGGRHLRALTLTSPIVGQTASENESHAEAATDPPSARSAKDGKKRSPTGQQPVDASGVPTSLMGDLRENLWTFIEDLKQATVGEEATISPEKPRPGHDHRASPRVQSRSQTPDKRASMPPPRSKPASTSFAPRPAATGNHPSSPVILTDNGKDDAEGWGWGSSPTSVSGFSEGEAAWSSPRTSTR